MEILRSLNAMREWRTSLATEQRVGFAPTMGNLHAGHIELINVVKQQSDVVVASIFVNPCSSVAMRTWMPTPEHLRRT